MTSPHEVLTITGYPEDRYIRLQETLAKKGLKIVGEDGEVKDFGADVKFHHEGTELILTVLHGPHLKNFDEFCKQLTSWVEEQV